MNMDIGTVAGNGITLGVDIGGSTTKIVGIRKNKLITPMTVKANDPIASLFGAFGKFVAENGLQLADIKQIMITGVGSSFTEKPIYNLPTAKVAEFLSNGLGGLYLSGLSKAIIASMGTGTALVKADENAIIHLGGTGVGGGTILGLSNRMLNIRDIELVIQKAKEGDLAKVDLLVGDITKDVLPGLPPYTTASNFGKISDLAASEDIALGIINLVLQTIGMTAIFAIKNTDLNDVVFIGTISSLPQCREIFKALEALFGVHFHIPVYSSYGTAIGAALAFEKNKEYVSLP